MSVANIGSNPYRSSSDNQQHPGANYLSNSPSGSGISSSLKRKIKRDFSKEYLPGVPNYIGINRNNVSKVRPYDSSNQLQI